MSLIWIWCTLFAAAAQTTRFVLQKMLAGSGLSAGGASFSRFVFGAPLAILGSVLALGLQGQALPLAQMGARFWGFALCGGAAQISATMLLVTLFGLRNFAVGVAFTKTEIAQVALFSALVLGEPVSGLGWAGIALGIAGVLAMSRLSLAGGILGRPTLYGVAAGGLFGLSAICYRGATLELGDLAFFTRAVVTLACVTTAQTLGMAVYLRLFEPGELGRVFVRWRRTVWVGITGALGSAGWFCAFALMNAAYVRAFGQIEMLFTLAASILLFHERLRRREAIGIALILGSLLLIILGGAR